MRWTVRLVGFVLLLLVLAWAVLHWAIVPRIDEFRPWLERTATRAITTPVSIGAVTAESNGLVPSIALHDVQVHDPTGRPGLRVARVLAAFSVVSLARRELEQLVIERPELEVRRTAQGRLLVGGVDLSGDAAGDTAAADWFFSQTEFLVLGGTLRWVDERRAIAPVTLSKVQLVMRNSRRRHQMRLDATPEAAWGGERFTLIGQFRQPVFSRHAGYWKDWDGQLYADFKQVDVSQARQYLDLRSDWGVDLRQGRGALRGWADVKKGQITGATADLALGTVDVVLGTGLQPLAFSSLTGRLGWRDHQDGLDVDTRGLQFVDADGLAWPGGNVQLRYREGGGELNGDKLDLAVLAKIAGRLPLPAAVHRQLKAHPVRGMVETLQARWDGTLEAPRSWRVRTRVDGLAVGARPAPANARGEPVEGIPGIEGARLELEATQAGGQARLDVRDGAMEFPGVFEEPRVPLAELTARARWRVQGERIEVDVDELKFANADARGSFKGRWQTADAAGARGRFPGVVDVQGSFSRANGARVYRYLPLGIAADARRYARLAVERGETRDATVRVKGNLLDVATAHPPAGTEFRIGGQVQGVTLNYVPRVLQPEGQAPWPALEDLSGELIFEHNSMRVNNARAKVRGHPGWQFSNLQVGIADLGRTEVVIDTEGRGSLPVALGIVRASPVAEFTRHALDRASATGEAALKLKASLPVARIKDGKIDGRITLLGNDLRVTPDMPLLTQAHGAVRFTDTGFSIDDARGRFLSGEVRLSGGSPNGGGGAGTPFVVVRASGTATAEALRQMTDWGPVASLARQAQGSSAYEATLGFGAGAPDVQLTSDLRGMSFNLPVPLAKPAEAAWPLRYDSRQRPLAADAPAGPARELLRLRVGELLAVEYEREVHGETSRVLRGALAVGAQAVPDVALPAAGVAARLLLPRVDVDEWEQALARVFGEGPGSGSGYLPTQWSLRVGTLEADERKLHDVVASGTRNGQVWRADVQARELAGRVEFIEGPEGRPGKLHARLSRLSIPASAADEKTAPLTDPPAHIPALDVVVEDFEVRGKKLGRLEIEAVNRDTAPTRQGAGAVQEWSLSRLVLRTPEASFSATGRWAVTSRAPALSADPRAPRAPNDPRRTALDFKLEMRDAGTLLARMDMPGVLARGKGQVEGSIGWAGSPFSPHYPSMEGKLRLDVGAGQFLKANAGAAKLLGVLSLQALPRRLALDFRDLFSAGFAFDSIRGDAAIQRGVASTNNLQMKGVNAAVLMEGSADIDKETADLRVLVVPEIDAGTAALAATLINPAIGIGAFVAQLVLKRPLIKAATREFHVSGPWDNPQVVRVTPTAGSSAARAASAAAGAADAPEPPDAQRAPPAAAVPDQEEERS